MLDKNKIYIIEVNSLQENIQLTELFRKNNINWLNVAFNRNLKNHIKELKRRNDLFFKQLIELYFIEDNWNFCYVSAAQSYNKKFSANQFIREEKLNRLNELK